MNPSAVLLPYVLAGLVSLTVAALAYPRRATPAALSFLAFMLCQALYSAGYIGELLADSLDAKVAWDSFQYVGGFGCSLAVVDVARRFVGKTAAHPVRFWVPATLVPVGVTAAALTEPWHRALRGSARIVPHPPFGALWYDFSWVDYLGTFFVYGCVVYALWLLSRHWRTGDHLVRRQSALLIVGLLVPLLANAVLVFVASPFQQRDPAPLLFLAMGLFFGWGLFQTHLFQLIPVARQVVLEHMSDGVVVADAQGRVVDANPAAIAILRPTAADITGQLIERLASQADVRLPTAGQPSGAAQRMSDAATDRWYEVSLHLINDPLGEAGGRLYVFRDVTASHQREHDLQIAKDHLESKVAERTLALLQEIEQRKRTERELAQSEQRFRAMFEHAFQLVGVVDLHGILLDVNRAALALAGCTLAEVAGRPFWQGPWWKDAAEEPARLQAALRAAARGQFVRYETVHSAPDGTVRHLDFSLKPVRDQQGNVTTIIAEGHDISDLKRFEQERLALAARLNEAQRMESLGRLAGGVAHDFNNLLTVINGNTSLMLAAELAADAREAASEILDAGKRAADLTRQLLAFSRRQVVEPRVMDAGQHVRGLQKLLPRVVGEDIAIQVHVDGDVGAVFMDPSQFEQIVMNLVVNARDAMPRGGRLDIGIARSEVAPAATTGEGPSQPGSYVVLTVGDDGSGIPDDVLPHIFEPFFTTKSAGRGTGLGLATVHGIVSQGNGTVTVASQAGRGTTFRVYLPSCDGTEDNVRDTGNRPAIGQRTGTVVVVEDQDSVRTLIARVLERHGFAVAAFADAASAVGHLAKATCDLVLTDVVMPEMGGRALADALRTRWPQLPIVFMSGHPDDTVLRHGIETAQEYFLQKPFTPAALVDKVRLALDRAGQGCARPSD